MYVYRTAGVCKPSAPEVATVLCAPTLYCCCCMAVQKNRRISSLLFFSLLFFKEEKEKKKIYLKNRRAIEGGTMLACALNEFK